MAFVMTRTRAKRPVATLCRSLSGEDVPNQSVLNTGESRHSWAP